MKKTFIKKLAAGLISAVALFASISCGNTLTGSGSENVITNPVSNKVYFKPNITDVTVSRTAYPDITVNDLKNIRLGLKKGKLDVDSLVVYDDYKAFKGAQLALEPGTYSFTLSAMCGGVYLSAEIPSKEYKAVTEDEPVDLTFEMSYVLTDAIKDGVGNVYFYFDYSKDKTLSDASIKFVKYDEEGGLSQYSYDEEYFTEAKSQTDGTHYIDYYLSNVPSGAYEIQVELKAEDTDDEGIITNSTATYKSAVYVANGCTTKESYTIKDGYWADKYQIGSTIYSNESDHMSAVAKDDGIHITVKLLDQDYEYGTMDIVEEDTQVGIGLCDWYYDWWYNNEDGSLNSNVVPRRSYTMYDGTKITTKTETEVVYPFVKKGQKYIFTLTRWADAEDNNGKEFWDNSEKIIVTATEDGVSVLEDDYANKMKRMAVEVSSGKYVATLKYDWRKLFETIDSSVFNSFEVTGNVLAGNKEWGGKTVNCTVKEDGSKVYHEWLFDNKNILTDEGLANYKQFLKGIDYTDVLAIKNCMEKKQYWINTLCEFKLNNSAYPVKYHTATIESDVVDAPTVNIVTVTLNKHADEVVSMEYIEDSVVELPDYSNESWNDQKFVGWYKDAEFTQKADSTLYCSEDDTFYAKWDLCIDGGSGNNPNYCNIDFSISEIANPDFVFSKNPVKITVKGKAASDHTGNIYAHLVNYTDLNPENNIYYTFLSYSDDTKDAKNSYKTGDDVELNFIFDPCDCDTAVDLAELPKKGINIMSYESSFQITDWSVTVEDYGTTEANEDGSIVTTTAVTNEDGSVVQTKRTRKNGESGVVVLSEEKITTDISGNVSSVKTDSDGTTTRKQTLTNGEVYETVVDNKGEISAVLKDENGQNIELTEYVFAYNEWGPDYTVDIPLTQLIPDEDFVEGDVINLTIKGYENDDSKEFRCRIGSRAEIDNWSRDFGLFTDGESTGTTTLAGKGDILYFNTPVTISKTAKTRDVNNKVVSLYLNLLSDESATQHRDSIFIMANITATLDKTNRVSPVTVSFESEEGTAPETLTAYPGQTITESITDCEKCFLNGWKDEAGNTVTLVPENDCTLTADFTKSITYDHPSWSNSVVIINKSILENNRNAYFIFSGMRKDYTYLGYQLNDLPDGKSGDDYRKTIMNAKTETKEASHIYSVEEILQTTDAFGVDYNEVQFFDWGDTDINKNVHAVLTYDVSNVTVKSWKTSEPDFTVVVPNNYEQLPENCLAGLDLYTDEACTQSAGIITEDCTLYLKMPEPVTSAEGRLTISCNPDVDGIVVTIRHLTEKEKNQGWCNFNFRDEDNCIQVERGWTGGTDMERSFVYPFVEAGKNYTFILTSQSNIVEWHQEVISYVSSVTGVAPSVYIKPEELTNINTTKLVPSEGSLTVTLTKDVRNFFNTENIKSAYLKVQPVGGNTWQGDYLDERKNYFIEDGASVNGDVIEQYLAGHDIIKELSENEFTRLSACETWEPTGNVYFTIPDSDEVFSTTGDFTIKHGTEPANFYYGKENPNLGSVSATVTIEKSSDITVTKTEDDNQITFTAASGFDSYEWKMGNKVLGTDSELIFNKSDYIPESYMITLYAKKNSYTYSCNIYIDIE